MQFQQAVIEYPLTHRVTKVQVDVKIVPASHLVGAAIEDAKEHGSIITSTLSWMNTVAQPVEKPGLHLIRRPGFLTDCLFCFLHRPLSRWR